MRYIPFLGLLILAAAPGGWSCVPKIDCPPIGDSCVGSVKRELVGSCKDYVECVNGLFVKKTCSWLHYFDGQMKECNLFWWATCDSDQNKPECLGTWTQADTQDCSKYYECSNGKVVAESCTFFRRFDREAKACTWMWNTPCLKPSMCRSGDRKAVHGDCSSYWECKQGQYVKQMCLLAGEMFDKDTLTCLPENEVNCLTTRSKREAISAGRIHFELDNIQQDEGSGDTKNPQDTTDKGSTSTPEHSTNEVTTPESSSPTPEHSTNKATTPESTSQTPDHTTDKVTTPEATTPKATTPEATTPKATTPDATTPEATTPEATTTPEPPTEAPTTVKPECNAGDKKAVNNSCTDFYRCDSDGKWIVDSCSSWCKHFNGAKCVWAWQFPCTVTTTAPPPTKAPTKPATVTSDTKSPTGPTDAPVTIETTTPACKEGSIKGIHGDCSNYEKCTNGVYVKNKCSFYQDFDCKKLECRMTFLATCC